MSSDKEPYEFTDDPRYMGDGALSVKVRFNYVVNGEPRSTRKSYTLHVENEQELNDRLMEQWEINNPNSVEFSKVKDFVKTLKGKKK